VFDEPPARIATLAPSLTEVVFAAGLGHVVAAVTTADDFPPAVRELRAFSALPLDMEALSAIQPDLVLGTDHVNDSRATEQLEAIGIPSLFFRFSSVSDVFRVMRSLCHLFGSDCPSADSLQARWDALQSHLPPDANRPTVLLLAGDDVLYSFGTDSYTEEMIHAAGGKSVTKEKTGQASVLSEEFVLAARPDIIVLTMGTDYPTPRLLELHPAWDVVPAIAQSRVFSVDPDYFLRPGPRLIDGAFQLRTILTRASITP
jgi:iron complex transport system substrate-binding protein